MLSHFMTSDSATLWTIGHQAALSVGFSRQECWSGLSCPPPGDVPDSWIEPEPLMSPALAAGLFTTSATGEMKQKPCYHHQKPNLNLNSWQDS